MSYATNTARFPILMPDALKERLADTAERLGKSSAEVARRAIARHLDEIDAEWAEGDGAHTATPSH